jgi:hypothetical protein
MNQIFESGQKWILENLYMIYAEIIELFKSYILNPGSPIYKMSKGRYGIGNKIYADGERGYGTNKELHRRVSSAVPLDYIDLMEKDKYRDSKDLANS